MATEFIIIRHGESLGNLNGVMLGHTDLDLSELGFLQAAAAANHFKNVKIDKIYSSDLKRAYNTAKAHADLRGMAVETDRDFREIFLGKWENARIDDVSRSEAELFFDGWRAGFGTFTPPGGESVRACGERFYNAVMRLAEKNVGKTVLIAAHAAVIRSFWGIISAVRPVDLAAAIPYPLNASASFVTYDENRLVPGEYSVGSYLSEVGVAAPRF